MKLSLILFSLLLILLFNSNFTQAQSKEYKFKTQAAFDLAMAQLNIDPDRANWKTLKLNGNSGSRTDLTDISLITTIKQCTALTSLNISIQRPGSVANIGAIAEAIKDMSGLQSLTIYCYSCYIFNIDLLKPAMANKTNLTYLNINFSSNSIQNVCEALFYVKDYTLLKTLHINFYNNQVKNLACFGTMYTNLSVLKTLSVQMEHNDITDANFFTTCLNNLDALTSLTLKFYNNQIPSFYLQDVLNELDSITSTDVTWGYHKDVTDKEISNFYFNSDTLVHLKLPIRRNLHAGGVSNLYTGLPNIEELTVTCEDTFTVNQLFPIIDQLSTTIKKVAKVNIRFAYDKTNHDFTDPMWAGLFDSLQNQVTNLDVYFDTSYNQESYANWRIIIGKLQDLTHLKFRIYRGYQSASFPTRFTNAKLIEFQYSFNNVKNVYNTFLAFGDLYTDMVVLEKTWLTLYNCGLENSNMLFFKQFYRSLSTSPLLVYFSLNLELNKLTSMSWINNSYTRLTLETLVLNMERNDFVALDKPHTFTQITDQDKLKSLTLYFSENEITHMGLLIAAIQPLTELTFLRIELHDNQIEDLLQLEGLLDNAKPNLNDFRFYVRGNPLTDQAEMNTILNPIFYFGKSTINTVYVDIEDIGGYSQPQGHGSLSADGKYLSISSDGYCQSTFAQAKYFTYVTNTKVCEDCPYVTCHMCSGAAKCDVCRYSEPPREGDDCHCPDGTKDGLNHQCIACVEFCAKCLDLDTCETCMDGYYLDSNVCHKCANRYARCSDATTGIECAGSYRTGQLPDCLCSPGYYDDGVTPSCFACAQPCFNCSDLNTCIDCIDGYYFDAPSSCLMCPIQFATCTSPTHGTSCSGTNRSDIAPGCACNPGYLDDPNPLVSNCIGCDINCATCSTTTDNCDTCRDNRINAPACTCPSHTYDTKDVHNGIGFCEECHVRCTECTDSATDCQSCQGSNRSMTAPDCTCNKGYFDDGKDINCTVCSYQCTSCENSATFCTECKGEFRQEIPDCICLDGYFDDGTSSDCQKCDESCLTCTESATNCLIQKEGVINKSKTKEDEGVPIWVIVVLSLVGASIIFGMVMIFRLKNSLEKGPKIHNIYPRGTDFNKVKAVPLAKGSVSALDALKAQIRQEEAGKSTAHELNDNEMSENDDIQPTENIKTDNKLNVENIDQLDTEKNGGNNNNNGDYYEQLKKEEEVRNPQKKIKKQKPIKKKAASTKNKL